MEKYSLTRDQLYHYNVKISTNSAGGYWSTFRALLKFAYKERWLNENINDHLESIEWEDPRINSLEMEEIKNLAATPCKVDY